VKFRLRKSDGNGQPILDAEGNPDTSFLARLPADTPFTFQTLDRRGMVLNMAQTWHQVRPGEMRVDCGGCHAHSQAPLPFAGTAASATGFQPVDLTSTLPLLTVVNGEPAQRSVAPGSYDVEFLADIRPILQARCVSCHQGANPAGNLNLNDLTEIEIPNVGGYPGDYYRLAMDDAAQFGYRSVIGSGRWRQTNASRYMRMFQSRRSLLIWKIFGQRLDGWTNADHPTETVPGNPATLPAGADPNAADIDFTGSIMPPPPALGLTPAILRALATLGHDTPTPIQQQAIPLVLEGHDLMAAAQTGTGKTGGFALPILTKLFPEGRRARPAAPRACWC
jgi:hypothetical protein